MNCKDCYLKISSDVPCGRVIRNLEAKTNLKIILVLLWKSSNKVREWNISAYFLLLHVLHYTVKSDIFIWASGKVRCLVVFVLHDVASQPLNIILLLQGRGCVLSVFHKLSFAVFSQRLAHASFFLHHLQKKDNLVLLMVSDFNLLLVKVLENGGSKEHIDIFPKDKLKQSVRCDETQTCRQTITYNKGSGCQGLKDIMILNIVARIDSQWIRKSKIA